MSFDVPADRYYAESHEWIDPETGKIGITDFAQDELGDVVFVELPAVGESVSAEEGVGVVESIKAVSDIYSPVAGTVEATNDAPMNEPELLNTDPFGEGWLFQLSFDEESGLDDLLSPEQYRAQFE